MKNHNSLKIKNIIPAIMPKDFGEVTMKVKKVADVVEWVQVDLMDGRYVPGKTCPYGYVSNRFLEMKASGGPLPEADKVNYEMDLMVFNPLEAMRDWITLGAKRFVIHPDTTNDIDGAIVLAREHNVEIGLALHADVPPRVVTGYVDEIDFVQCMGIRQIGLQGEPFTTQVLHNIRVLRELRADLMISVDGSVNRNTIVDLHQAGANCFVAGSAIFNERGEENNIRTLADLVAD